MVRDDLLKKSFMISLFIHMLILSPWPGFKFTQKLNKESRPAPLLIAYKISPQENIKIQMEKKRSREKTISQKLKVKSNKNKKEGEKAGVKKKREKFLMTKAPQFQKRKVRIKKNQIVSLSGNINTKFVPESVINYYHAIREEIKRKAYYYRPEFQGKGIVTVLFSVSSDGVLQNLAIDETHSTKNSILCKSALKSVKYASPFPPFPPEIESDFITFSITIEFELGRN